MYTKILYAGWGDMDFNSHMRNTAYLDKTADVRQMQLAAMNSLERSSDFVVLPSSMKPRAWRVLKLRRLRSDEP